MLIDIKLETLTKLPKRALILLLCILCAGIAPGYFVLLLYWPEVVVGSDYTKLIFLSAMAASPVVLPSFVVISVLGYAAGKPRTTQIFMSEFAFSLFTCLISYGIALFVCYLFGLSLKVFIPLTLLLAVLAVWYFVKMRQHGNV